MQPSFPVLTVSTTFWKLPRQSLSELWKGKKGGDGKASLVVAVDTSPPGALLALGA